MGRSEISSEAAAAELGTGRPLSLVVLGGGTAGWITACWLLRQFGHHPGVQVTLVESKAVGILGVDRRLTSNSGGWDARR
jgi:2-polyprenyl-6-methoxyphenol hydroxylase-like FAD-dependent oxidoreductase